MKVGVPKESFAGETRVALVPDVVGQLTAKGLAVYVQAGAGLAAGYPDTDFKAKGASIVEDRKSILATCDIIAKVRAPNDWEVDHIPAGATVISLLWPLQAPNHDLVRKIAAKKITAFAMDLIPRISRAQSMDVLSSQSNIAGYKAVLLAATDLPKLFPLLMTAAGTIQPARVFVIGAGVAGLQAIATAKRLGAIVEAFDVRPVVKEQVESLGAKFVQLELQSKDAQDAGGYAKAQSEEFLKKQQELMSSVIRASDAVITTALIPGQKAPILVPEEAVKGMRPGSVVVDLAAEQGGNCPLTEPGKTVVKHGVTIHGHTNLPATVAFHASQMYAKNLSSFLLLMWKDGALKIDTADEIVRETLTTKGGEVVAVKVRKAMGLPVPDPQAAAKPTAAIPIATPVTPAKGK